MKLPARLQALEIERAAHPEYISGEQAMVRARVQCPGSYASAEAAEAWFLGALVALIRMAPESIRSGEGTGPAAGGPAQAGSAAGRGLRPFFGE